MIRRNICEPKMLTEELHPRLCGSWAWAAQTHQVMVDTVCAIKRDSALPLHALLPLSEFWGSAANTRKSISFAVAWLIQRHAAYPVVVVVISLSQDALLRTHRCSVSGMVCMWEAYFRLFLATVNSRRTEFKDMTCLFFDSNKG